MSKDWQPLIFVALIAIGFESNAERATDGKMAADALMPFVVDAGSNSTVEQLQAQKQLLDDNSSAHPDEVRSASFVFHRGLSKKELANFLSRHELTVVGIQIKAPLSDRGKIFTTIVGLDELLQVRGDIQSQIQHVLDSRRSRIARKAQVYSTSPQPAIRKRGQEYQELLEEIDRIYSVDVIGSTQSLSSASDEQPVAGVFLDKSDAKIRNYELLSSTR